MASRDEDFFAFKGHKIMNGPPRIDLLQAFFFNREMALIFDLDDRNQIMCKLHGLISGCVAQSLTLIVSYHPRRAPTDEGNTAIIVYDTHRRTGRFVDPKTIPELLSQPWY